MNTYARNQVLGRYRVIRRLGSGGMATVYLARDERLGREVAVKRLHADSPEDMARRLEREARVGASLNHPNLATVYDTGTDPEGVVVVMEYVEGETLGAMLRRGRLEPEHAMAVLAGVADALDHAHAAGVVHRDVKPGNILLRRDGAVKLVDLGIAKAAAESRVTRTGNVMGTAAYMAPEQLRGGDVCPQTDVYALAAVAFETLSGRKPREGRTPMEVAHRVVSEPPPELRSAWPDAPAAASEALARGMALEPGDRPSSAGELTEELSAAMHEHDTVPVAAPTEPMTEPLTREHTPVPPPPTRATAAPPPTRPAAPPPPAPVGRRRRTPALAAALAAILAVAALAAVLLVGGGSGDPVAGNTVAEERASDAGGGDGGEGGGGGGSGDGGSPAPAEPEAVASAAGVPAPSETPDPAQGTALNEEGKSLIDSGDPEAAIPVLEQSVSSFPEGTDDIQYAYALYNLGNAYRLAGRPEDAIPVLEARLEIPDQREAVQAELDLAREAAGG
jgi:serine/threonine-protein kinase